jgi:hypothetical protein
MPSFAGADCIWIDGYMLHGHSVCATVIAFLRCLETTAQQVTAGNFNNAAAVYVHLLQWEYRDVCFYS